MSLTNLVNLFSETKLYGKYSEKGSFPERKAEKVIEDSLKLDKKNEALYKKLEG